MSDTVVLADDSFRSLTFVVPRFSCRGSSGATIKDLKNKKEGLFTVTFACAR